MSNVTAEKNQVTTADLAQPATSEKKHAKAPRGGNAAKAPRKGHTGPKGKRPAAKTANKAGKSPAAERTNKKAEVIAMMRRPKGATLAEIMAATGWQKHTVRGFVSILGKKGEAKIESSKNSAGERAYKIGK